jgi:hypothetical protein
MPLNYSPIPPESPPPEPPHFNKVSKSKLLSPISLVISAFEWRPKTSGLVIFGKFLINSIIASCYESSQLNL